MWGEAGPGEASKGGATGHAATHTAVSLMVSGGVDQGETGEEGEVVLEGGGWCTMHREGRDGGGGVEGGGGGRGHA